MQLTILFVIVDPLIRLFYIFFNFFLRSAVNSCPVSPNSDFRYRVPNFDLKAMATYASKLLSSQQQQQQVQGRNNVEVSNSPTPSLFISTGLYISVLMSTFKSQRGGEGGGRVPLGATLYGMCSCAVDNLRIFSIFQVLVT